MSIIHDLDAFMKKQSDYYLVQGSNNKRMYRKKYKELEEKGYLLKVEQHTNKVGTSERTKAVIEPRLSDQWFLKMDSISKPALDSVLNKEVNDSGITQNIDTTKMKIEKILTNINTIYELYENYEKKFKRS